MKKIKKMRGKTASIKTGCGDLMITINKREKGYQQLLKSNGSKSGSCFGCVIEAMGRIMGVAIKAGIDPKELASHLKDIQCPRATLESKSCFDGIARVWEEYLSKEKK